MTTPTALNQRSIARFYLPLMLNVQLMSVSHTIINGALARQSNPVTDLAAFGVAVSLHLFIASIAFQNHTLVLSKGKSRRGFRQVCLFSGLLALLVTVTLALFGYTPFGRWVLIDILGVTSDVADGAQAALRVMTFLPVFTGSRGLAQGLLIRARRTELVSLSTLVRIAALIAGLTLGAGWFSGPQLGAFALWLCITVEAGFALFFCRKFPVPWQADSETESFGQLVRFALPLCFSSGLQLTIPLLVSAIISRLPDGKEALAGFGVIRSFLFMLAGPQRNLQQAYLALVHSKEDNRQLWRFNLLAGGVLATLMILIAVPFSATVLGQWMGLTAVLRQQIALPMVICALFPVGVGLIYQNAGRLTETNHTGTIGTAVCLKAVYLLLLWAVFTRWSLTPPWSGVLTGIGLFISAQWIEMLFLFGNSRRHP